MGNRLARGLKEVTDDPAALSDGNFWAVTSTFEGRYRFARFSDISESAFPSNHSEWEELSGRWNSSMGRETYCRYVETIRSAISEGDVYQVNACRELSMLISSESLGGLFRRLLQENPAPYASYVKLPDLEIASASPERFLKRTGNMILTSPIKGTQVLSAGEFGDKDQSENIMIVDLMRNDLGIICKPGSVDVSALLRSEEHPGLRHLVSDVSGVLRDEITWTEILGALLPPGSVSGAPKSSALRIISDNEPVPRSQYCGVIGWVHGDQADLAVAIRTFWQSTDRVLRFGTGAGVTWGSNAEDEWDETQLKARHLLSIAGGDFS